MFSINEVNRIHYFNSYNLNIQSSNIKMFTPVSNLIDIMILDLLFIQIFVRVQQQFCFTFLYYELLLLLL